MERSLLAAVVMAVTFHGQRSAADAYGPYPDFRVAPQNCQVYASVENEPRGRGQGLGPVIVSIVKQPEGTRRPPGITWWYSDEMGRLGPSVVTKRDVSVVPGDEVVGEFKLKFPPRRLLVASNGGSVVAIGARTLREEGADDDLVFVTRGDGHIVAHLGLDDLFGKAAATVYSTGEWARKYPGLTVWIDEARELLLVSPTPAPEIATRLLVAVSLADGRIRAASAADVLRSIAIENKRYLEVALNVAAEMSLDVPKQRLLDVFESPGIPTATRVIAASMLCDIGDKRGEHLLSSLAQRALDRLRNEPLFDLQSTWLPPLGDLVGHNESTEELIAIDLAVQYLPKALDDKAVPLLAEIAGASQGALRDVYARKAALSLGTDAVPGLVAVLMQSRSRNRQSWSANVLAEMHGTASGAVGALVSVLQRTRGTAGEPLRASIIYTLGEIGPAASCAIPVLKKCLADPSESVRKRAALALEKIRARANS